MQGDDLNNKTKIQRAVSYRENVNRYYWLISDHSKIDYIKGVIYILSRRVSCCAGNSCFLLFTTFL